MSKRSLPASFALNCGLFILSSSAIALELVGMRILSFMLWHHLAYMVLSVALLGFGASGAWLAARFKDYDPRVMMTRSALLFAVSNLLGFMLLAHIQLDTFHMSAARLVKLGFYYAVLFLPYFFAGLAVAVIFREAGHKTTSLYFVNMVGSGLGCELFMVAITPLGALKAVAGISLLGSATALMWSLGGARRLVAQAAATLAVIAGLFPFSDALIPARPAPSKALAVHMKYPGARVDFTEWTPLSRIDVAYADSAYHPFMEIWVPGDRMRTLTIDGDATTWIFNYKEVMQALNGIQGQSYRELLRYNSYAMPFLIKDRPETLIVGVGGGNEIAIALAARAKHVTGVELNSSILAQTTHYLRDFYGNLYDGKRATPVVAEGRSYVRRSNKLFDIIQMSGVDTWSGLSSGAYVLSENYLYTVEATKDFLGHLEPDGILSIGRYLLKPPRESLRMMSNALKALKEMGVPHPENHIIVISSGVIGGARMLVKRSPFTRAEVDYYYDLAAKDPTRTIVFWYGPYLQDKLRPNPFETLVSAVVKGPESERDFYRYYPYDVTPVYDNKPFFFEYYKWKNLFRNLGYGGKGGQIGANKPVALVILLSLLGQVILLSLAFILVPLLQLRRRGEHLSHPAPILIGFGGLGLAFMLVEVGLMQKFVLFLGHPTYSISITLSAMLIGSGLGSLAAGGLPGRAEKKLLLSIFGIVAVTLLYLWSLGGLFDALLGHSMAERQAVSFALICVLAFPMGMPFPLSLERCRQLGPQAVPWALGINGGASVLGGVLCIIIAISVGFSAVLLCSCALYLAALPCLILLQKSFNKA